MGRDVTVARKVLKWASFWQWGGAALKDVAVLLTDPESWGGEKFRRLSRWKAPPRQDEPEYVPDYGPRIYRIDPATQAMEVAFRLYVPREFGVRAQIRGSFTWSRWRAMEDLGDGLYEFYRERIMPGDWYEFRVSDEAGTWTEITDPMAYRFAKQFDWETKKYNSHALVPSIAYDMQSSAPALTSGLVICECSLPGLLHGLSSASDRSAGPGGPSIIARLLECDVASKLRERGFTGVMFPIQASVANLWDYEWTFNYLVNGLGAIDAELGDWDEMKQLVDSFHAAGILVIPDIILVHHVKNSSTRGIEKLKDGAGRSLWFDDDPFLFRDYGTWMLNLENPQIRNHLVEMVVRFIRELHLGAFRFDYVDGLVFQYALGHRAAVSPNGGGTAPLREQAGASADGEGVEADGESRATSVAPNETGGDGADTGDEPIEAAEPGGSSREATPKAKQDDIHDQVGKFLEVTTADRPRALTAGERLLDELIRSLDAHKCKAIRFSEAFSTRHVPTVKRMAHAFYEPWVGVVAMSDLMNGKALAGNIDITRTIAGVGGASAVHRPNDVMTYVVSHDEAAEDAHVMAARARDNVGESAGGHLAELLWRFAEQKHSDGRLPRAEMLDFVARHALMLESLTMFSGNFAHLQLNGASDSLKIGNYDLGWQFVWDMQQHPDIDEWVRRSGRSRQEVADVLTAHQQQMMQIRKLYRDTTPLDADAPRGRLAIEVVGQWEQQAAFAFSRTDPRHQSPTLLLAYNFCETPVSPFRTSLRSMSKGSWTTRFALAGRGDSASLRAPSLIADGGGQHLQLVLPGYSMAVFQIEGTRSRA